MEWEYGDHWEAHPIEEGEIWEAGPNRLMATDIMTDDLLSFGDLRVDMTYVDPPWNLGNLSSFFTKAYKINTISFLSLIKRILEICKEISPDVNYMEMGKQSISSVRQLIENLGGVVTNQWDTTYYRKHPSHLLRYSFTGIAPVSLDLDGVDDDDTPAFVIAAEQPVSLADLCTGRGLTGRVCYDQGVTFYGTKLNKRRLANLLAFYHNKGLEVKRSG